MNLPDAFRSGRPFRRLNGAWFTTEHDRYLFARADITATDWEIEEPEIKLTRTQFWQACAKVLKNCEFYGAHGIVKYSGKDAPPIQELQQLSFLLFGEAPTA